MFTAIMLSIFVAGCAGAYAWIVFVTDDDAAEMARYRAERDAFERLMK